MTQEEKARAYDGALERAKEEYQSSRNVTKTDILEYVFPVLRESEDERIRNWILEKVQGYADSGIPFPDEIQMANKAITYLEKQKGASKAIEAVERIDKYIDEHLANAHDMKDSNPDKKYYRGWDDALGKMSGILQDVYSNEKQKEQKPAEWSKEDERILQNIISDLREFRDCETDEELISDYEDEIYFLKQLPERFNPQPRQEWGDEDDRMLTEIIARGSSQIPHGEPALREDQLEWLMNRLKSLRSPQEQQFHYKPSKEQMEALEDAAKHYRDTHFKSFHRRIDSLVSDLKKLM